MRGVRDPEIRARLGPWLEQRGLERGWSIRRFAEEAEIDHSTLSLILRGETLPTPETLAKLTDAIRRHKPKPGMKEMLDALKAPSLNSG